MHRLPRSLKRAGRFDIQLKINHPKEEDAYKSMYEEGNAMPRNKDMSNYKDEKLPLKGELYNFYLNNKLKTK